MDMAGVNLNEFMDRVNLLEKMYEDIRLVDPVNKQVISIKSGLQSPFSSCYAFWDKDAPCDNCVSMRAYLGNNTYFKLEHKNGKAILITAIPVNLQDRTLIMEFIKDVTHTMVFESDVVENKESLMSHMNSLAVRDPLSGLYNRRFISERLPADLATSLLKKESLALIMVDLDNFKQINDNYGHLAGDLVIQKFGDFLQSHVRRSMDWAARFGGEEFLICLHNISLPDAVHKAETMRDNMRKFAVQYYDMELCLTASFGVSVFYNEKVSLEEALERVDKKLYQAKNSGRNKVCY